ncbi:MAG: DUF4384 domain-containing protein [Thermoguttaceae bacterium]|nr:DUF4384 domain-containing protein [Thermoguttaceae bacterium]
MMMNKQCRLSLLLSAGMLFFAASFAFAQTYKEEGRVEKEVWSGYWWPTSRGEILGPLAKYDQLTGSNAVSWEKKNRPSQVNGRSAPDWTGLCHGWSASSVMEVEPRQTVLSHNIQLSTGDQKGWLAIAHSNDVANVYGKRYSGPNDDPSDLSPEELWKVLRAHIKEQGVPLVLDIEPKEQVWNYPVYAYRVEYAPKAGSTLCQGKICVWMADDAVPKNFIGLKQAYQEYTFEAEIQNGSIVMGTGHWTGNSVNVHPDFAWFPYIVRSGNSELTYENVCLLLGRKPAGDPTPATAPETTPATTPATAPATAPETTAVTAPESARPETDEACLSYAQLISLLAEKKSDFNFNVEAVGRMDGRFREGEMLTLGGICESDGYLYIFAINPQGNISLLYPQPGDHNAIKARERFILPDEHARYTWELGAPLGIHRVKAVVTERPILFTGLPAAKSEMSFADADKVVLKLSELAIRTTPSESKSVGSLLPDAKGGGLPGVDDATHAVLGRFAQDEVVIYVGKNSKKRK